MELKGKNIVGLESFDGDSLEELRLLLDGKPFGLAISDKSGYLAYLTFPFGGRRRIGMVIREELENCFPFPLDDVYFDFQEIGKGRVLAAAIPKVRVEKSDFDKNIKVLTLNSIAALYALRWLKIISEDSFLFVSTDKDTASIMVFREGQLCDVRQMVYSGQIGILKNAIEECANQGDVVPGVCYLVCDHEETDLVGRLKSSGVSISIALPHPDSCLQDQGFASYYWAGIGAALLSIPNRDEINILGESHAGFPRAEKLTLYAGGGLALVSLIVAGMFYLNVYLKDRAYKVLSFEQMNVFRSVFPKSPPVKDTIRVLEDRIKSMEREGLAGGKSPLQLLSDISEKIDNTFDIKLGEFSVEGTEFTVAGSTVSFASAETIAAKLAEINGVKGVEIQTLDLVANQVKFRIRGKL